MEPRKDVKNAARARFGPPRKLSALMSLVGLSGLIMAQVAPRNGAPGIAPPRVVPVPPYLWTAPGPVPPTVAIDRFVVAAPEGIDPGFVAVAPAGIDDGLVVPAEGRFATSGR